MELTNQLASLGKLTNPGKAYFYQSDGVPLPFQPISAESVTTALPVEL
jgi:hypothetical protein